jgi:hypothetical protein
MYETLGGLAMLSPQQTATIEAEIEKLKYARKHCSDSGVQKVIEGWIEGEKMKLNSGDNQGLPAPNNRPRIPSKPSE